MCCWVVRRLQSLGNVWRSTKGRAAGPVFVPSPVVLSGSHTRSTMLGMQRGSWGIHSENRRSRVVESFHNREGMPKSSASQGFGVVTCVNLQTRGYRHCQWSRRCNSTARSRRRSTYFRRAVNIAKMGRKSGGGRQLSHERSSFQTGTNRTFRSRKALVL